MLRTFPSAYEGSNQSKVVKFGRGQILKATIQISAAYATFACYSVKIIERHIIVDDVATKFWIGECI